MMDIRVMDHVTLTQKSKSRTPDIGLFVSMLEFKRKEKIFEHN